MAPPVMDSTHTERWKRSVLEIWIAALTASAALALTLVGGVPAQAAPHCKHLSGGRSADGLDGRGGADCLNGARGDDFLDGGPGNDKLIAGAGRDQLLAGSGQDRISAGPGNDLISARDGRAETVRCGSGNDLVSADASDVLIGCEKVHLYAAQEEWMRFSTRMVAFGSRGSCNGTAAKATCKGGAEAGVKPFDSGSITMQWDKRTVGVSGQHVVIMATDVDGMLLGHSDLLWRYLGINGGRVRQFVDPNNGVFRTGDDVNKVGEQGGPLSANLSFQGNGYSLDLQGWLRVIRF
jgi:Ca2+-binding RTX toxin-like protein